MYDLNDDCPDDLSYWNVRAEWERTGREVQEHTRRYLKSRTPTMRGAMKLSALGDEVERLAR